MTKSFLGENRAVDCSEKQLTPSVFLSFFQKLSLSLNKACNKVIMLYLVLVYC